MGTRADFYVGRGKTAEWLGSIALDGYPGGTPWKVVATTTEAEFRAEVAALSTRPDFTTPAMGWPWPWENSRTTDYAYAFDNAKVWRSNFGRRWEVATSKETDSDGPKEVDFPEMSGGSATMGPRSGVIILGGK